MLRTRLCDLLNIEYPVVLAGMGGVARADLVAAVSNAGGLGVIGAAGMGVDELRAEIRRVKELTDKPFGVDIILPAGVPGGSLPDMGEVRQQLTERFTQQIALVRDLRQRFGLPPQPGGSGGSLPVWTGDFFRRQVDTILEEGAPVFATGLGNPAPFMPELRAAGMKVISLAGNIKAARRLADAGVDVVVAQGHEAGGHTGRIGTMALVPQVVDAVGDRCLVVAAGGIGDGRGLVAALALGAVGVWVGTRFIATNEAYAGQAWKLRLTEASEEDTRVTRAYTGKTMRGLHNQWIQAWEDSHLEYLPMPFQSMLAGGDVLDPLQTKTTPDIACMPSGQVAGLIHEVKPAGDVLRDIVTEAEQVLDQRLPVEVRVRQ